MKSSTKTLIDRVSRCESLDEYKELFKSLASQREEWSKKINRIMAENNYSASEFAQKCKVSRVTVQKWKNGSIPKNRETFIRIGFAANYSLNEMNNFLERYGRCQRLYARNLEDSVYIFVLASDDIEHTYQKCEAIIDLINKEMEKTFIEDALLYDTSNVLTNIINIQSVEELVEFVKTNAGVFANQYNKFYSFVEMYINLNRIGDTSDRNNVSMLMTNCSPSLKFCVYDIVNHKWYPKRNKIISLGIYLNMSAEQINEMLRLANMEELCPRNPFENSIIYALESAMLENVICLGTDTLRNYVKNILNSLGFTDAEFLLDEIDNEFEDVI